MSNNIKSWDGVDTVGDRRVAPQKIKIELTYHPAIQLLGISIPPKIESRVSERSLYTHVHGRY